MTLGDFNFKSNSIGFFRLAFALVVVWSHAFTSGGFGFDPVVWFTRGIQSCGTLAVGGFFVLSGFLITRSYENLGNVWRFLWHRFLRIFPGYWTCLVVVAFVVAPLAFYATHNSLSGFFSVPNSPAHYVLYNASLIYGQPVIGDITAHLPDPYSINGSLWTLQVEFACYLLVAAIGVVGWLGVHWKRAGFYTILLLTTTIACEILAPDSIMRQVGQLFSYFLIGSAAYVYRNQAPMRAWGAICAAAAAIALLRFDPAGVGLPACLAYVVLYLSMTVGPRSFDRKVDLSYGVYIYAFPVQQLLAIHGVAGFGFLAFLSATLAITLPVAAISWYALERPCLRLKNLGWPPGRPLAEGTSDYGLGAFPYGPTPGD